MHDQSRLTLDRAKRILEERIRPAIHRDAIDLDITRHTVGADPIPVADALAADYEPIATGTIWGAPWHTTWFHVAGSVPAEFAGERVEVVLDLGFDKNLDGFQHEGLVYRADGTPVRSLNPRAHWIPVVHTAAGGENYDFYIEAAANPVVLGYHPFVPTQLGDITTSGGTELYRFERAQLAIFDREVFELTHDVEVLVQLVDNLPEEGARRGRILIALGRSLDALDVHDIHGTAAAARAELVEVLSAPAEASAHHISAIGHAHIDTAWLWPLRETIRKVARTTSSMTTLLDEEPDFLYAMSSAQQYAWIKEHRPEVYERVKAAVAAGRFIPIGGMWVEPDAVLPSGESLIRQITQGQKFFREEFGLENRGAWLPDSFGYTGSLPGILTGSGFEWFLTQKISWNQVNKFPHHSFLWEGIDGSRIFTHFPPMDTYNSQLSGDEVARSAKQFKERAVASSSLAPTGFGDGGGGTTREMIARAARMRNLEGTPQVEWETPDAFFDRAMAELPNPEVWLGELYLELHRGTFTSQHKTKQGNRRNEVLLYEAELWATTASIQAGFEYPYEALDSLWQQVLLLQFHDILPGSSIAWVHREAEEQHAQITEQLQQIIADALGALGVTLASDGALVVRSAPFAIAGATARSVAPAPAPEPRVAVAEGDSFVLESEFVSLRFDASGLLISAVDRASGREALVPGFASNLFELFSDTPNMWDAWDLDKHYQGSRVPLVDADSVTVDGTSLVVVRSFGKSKITQTLSLDAAARVLLIDLAIDWHEDEKVLKLGFTVDVATSTAVAETQFGLHSRTTHENTSWEAARFETQAQRWFLVEEPDFGVAFANESSHGFDVTRVDAAGNVAQQARFTVLRAANFPDPNGDRGEQHLRYAVAFGADSAIATQTGFELNVLDRAATGTAVAPLVSSSNERVIVSAVKLADDHSGDLVVRVYEPYGARASTTLTFGDAVRAAGVTRTNHIEREFGEYLRRRHPVAPTLDNGVVALDLRPFEVVTLRVQRGDAS